MGEWRRTFVSGLIVLIPILVCAYPLFWVYTQILQLPVLQEIQPPVLRVFLILLVLGVWTISIGYLMRTALGEFLDQQIDAAMERFPGIRVLHSGLKNVLKFAILRRDVTQIAVKVETWENLYMTGFRTGNWTPDGREVIFIPGAPDLTSGFVAEVKPEDVIETDETLMDALTRLLSCGFGETREQSETKDRTM